MTKRFKKVEERLLKDYKHLTEDKTTDKTLLFKLIRFLDFSTMAGTHIHYNKEQETLIRKLRDTQHRKI